MNGARREFLNKEQAVNVGEGRVAIAIAGRDAWESTEALVPELAETIGRIHTAIESGEFSEQNANRVNDLLGAADAVHEAQGHLENRAERTSLIYLERAFSRGSVLKELFGHFELIVPEEELGGFKVRLDDGRLNGAVAKPVIDRAVEKVRELLEKELSDML